VPIAAPAIARASRAARHRRTRHAAPTDAAIARAVTSVVAKVARAAIAPLGVDRALTLTGGSPWEKSRLDAVPVQPDRPAGNHAR
jgi:hypothetical protein